MNVKNLFRHLSTFLILSILMIVKSAISVPQKGDVYQYQANDRNYGLKVKVLDRNRFLFVAYKKNGNLERPATITVTTPNGRTVTGNKIYRNRAVYVILSSPPGRFIVKLKDGNRNITFPVINVPPSSTRNNNKPNQNSARNNQSNQRAVILSLQYPKEIDVGKSRKTPFKVWAKTSKSTSRLIIQGRNVHHFKLMRERNNYKIWLWKHTFYPGEVPPGSRKVKRMVVKAFNNQGVQGDTRTISFVIKNSRPRPNAKKELLNLYIKRIRADVGRKCAECNGRCGGYCGECKHYLQQRLSQIAKAYNFRCSNGQYVYMPHGYGISWSSPGCAFGIVYTYRGTTNSNYNRNKIRQLLRTVEWGDVLQMRWKPGYKLYPHTLIFTSKLYGNRIQVCDSNFRSDKRVSCRTMNINYFLKALDCPQCGATLYRLRDDIKKGY